MKKNTLFIIFAINLISSSAWAQSDSFYSGKWFGFGKDPAEKEEISETTKKQIFNDDLHQAIRKKRGSEVKKIVSKSKYFFPGEDIEYDWNRVHKDPHIMLYNSKSIKDYVKETGFVTSTNPLFEAIYTCNIEVINALIEEGVNINTALTFGGSRNSTEFNSKKYSILEQASNMHGKNFSFQIFDSKVDPKSNYTVLSVGSETYVVNVSGDPTTVFYKLSQLQQGKELKFDKLWYGRKIEGLMTPLDYINYFKNFKDFRSPLDTEGTEDFTPNIACLDDAKKILLSKNAKTGEELYQNKYLNLKKDPIINGSVKLKNDVLIECGNETPLSETFEVFISHPKK